MDHLRTAVENRYIDNILQFIKDGVVEENTFDQNMLVEKSEIPFLHAVCSIDNFDIIKALNDKFPECMKKNVNRFCNNGRNLPVMWTDNPKIIELLISIGANLELQNSHGNTFLSMLIYHGFEKGENESAVKAIEILLEKGADPNKSNNNGDTALIFLACYGFKDGENISAVKAIEILLEKGADPNKSTNTGDIALSMLVYHGFNKGENNSAVKAIELLLEKGGNPNKANQNGCIPLSLLAYRGFEKGENNSSVKAIELLLKKGADPNRVNKNGDTSLSILTNGGFNKGENNSAVKAIRLLLENGADPYLKNNKNKDFVYYYGKKSFYKDFPQYKPQSWWDCITRKKKIVNNPDTGYELLDLVPENNI